MNVRSQTTQQSDATVAAPSLGVCVRAAQCCTVHTCTATVRIWLAAGRGGRACDCCSWQRCMCYSTALSSCRQQQYCKSQVMFAAAADKGAHRTATFTAAISTAHYQGTSVVVADCLYCLPAAVCELPLAL